MSSNTAYDMFVRQQPEAARACGSADIPDRRPVDPVVILQLRYTDASGLDESGLASAMTSTALFCYTSIEKHDSRDLPQANRDLKSTTTSSALLTGTITSSICYMKDPVARGKNGAFFVFPDLNIRLEGTYILKFHLFGLASGVVKPLARCTSNPVTVYSAKRFPGMTNSTELTRSFANQGLKLRLRKEIRGNKRKRDMSTESQSPYRGHSNPVLALHNRSKYCSKSNGRGPLPSVCKNLKSGKHGFRGSSSPHSRETYGKSMSGPPYWFSLAHTYMLPKPLSQEVQLRTRSPYEQQRIEMMSASTSFHLTKLQPIRTSSLHLSVSTPKNLPSFDKAFPDFRHIISQHDQYKINVHTT